MPALKCLRVEIWRNPFFFNIVVRVLVQVGLRDIPVLVRIRFCIFLDDFKLSSVQQIYYDPERTDSNRENF